MAYLSKSSPGQGRRLSELLEEQQEPFLLDVYLLEKGYSDRLFTSQATSMCWPVTACKRLHRLTSHGFRKRRMRCQLLRCMLTKFLNGKVIRKALNWDKEVLHLSDTGSKNNATEADQLSCSRWSTLGEMDGEIRCKCMEVDDSKQFSPVSVLELHSFEGSPDHITNIEEDISTLNLDSPTKDFDAFKELLELAFTPAFNQFAKSKRQLDQPEKLLSDCEQDDKRTVDSHECLAHEISESIIHDETTSWQWQKGVLTSITQLTFSDISNSRREWYEFQPQVRDIGIHIEEAIFEDIREDVILEMLGFRCTFARS